jgi:ABC-type sulfate transport system permease component
LKSVTLSWSAFWGTVLSPRLLASYRLSLGASLLSALTNAVFGLLVTWVLVRYQFPGKRLLDGLVDLPFALPTAVAGIALTTLYSANGWIGRYLDLFSIRAVYAPLGIVIARRLSDSPLSCAPSNLCCRASMPPPRRRQRVSAHAAGKRSGVSSSRSCGQRY